MTPRYDPIAEYNTTMSLVKEFGQRLSVGDKRACPKCGVEKDREADFHQGASMCKACKRQADMDRREGRTGVTNAELLAMIMKMAAKIDKLEIAVVKLGGKISDDDEEPPKKAVKITGFSKESPKSDVDSSSDESEEEAVKKQKKVGKTEKIPKGKTAKKTDDLEKKATKKSKKK